MRLAAADESLELAGHGLPRRTEFVAHLHRAALRLHLGDVAGFEADHAAGAAAGRLAAAARRCARTCCGRPAALAWLRGNAARAEELTTEAYELFRQVTPHARHAYAAHQFTLRRADHRQADAIALLVETGDEGSPLLQEMAVLAAAESGDLAEARRLRARWGRTAGPRLGQRRRRLYLQAESALWLGDEPEWAAAAESLLPYRGRQAVLGTPSLTPRRLRRAARPDRRAPRRRRRRAASGGRPPASRACSSAHRTRWRWPSRTSPAWTPPASDRTAAAGHFWP